MNVNNKVLAYLESKGIGQTGLAKKMGMSKQNLFRLLNSDDIKISQLVEITKALEVSFTYFFDGTENISNDEVERYKKRIVELEEMLGDKRRIIAEIEKHEVDNVKKLLNDIIENEYKTLSDEEKKEARKIVLSEAKGAINGRSILYDLNKRSEIIELIYNDLIAVRDYRPIDTQITFSSDNIKKQSKKTQRKTRKFT